MSLNFGSLQALADDLDFQRDQAEKRNELFLFDTVRLDDLRDYLALLGYQELTCTVHTTREDFPHITIELRQELAPIA